MLSGIPDGTHCFVDANIICYHIINVPPVSAECSLFFKRLENRRLRATTSTAVIAEAIHRVMLAEAVQKHRLDHRGLAMGSNRISSGRRTLLGHTWNGLTNEDGYCQWRDCQ